MEEISKTGRQRRRYESIKSVHNAEPDYTRPLLEFPKEAYDTIAGRLRFLYGDLLAESYMPELARVCKVYYAHKPPEMVEKERDFDPIERFTEEDVILITYGDIMHDEKESSPLTTLSKFCGLHLKQAVNTLHILPFFPYSSDRGFSVVDFETVDPRLGTWADIEDLESRYQLMFDGVINHVSSKSHWFQEFLNGNPRYKNFFIAYDDPRKLTDEQRRMIFRPRTTDILSQFASIEGPRYVWSTFSPDQIDLNYQNPEVLIKVLEILLMYVRRGADIIRLDAITYLWSRPGTRCIHLDETHEIVRLFRDVLNVVAPGVALITETNVPHEENISYFGNGLDEAQMVYNFALPPLALYTFYTEDSTALTRWATALKPPTDTTHFFNFLDSHDGVGLMAVRNILTKEQIDFMVRRAREHGGLVSYKAAREGGEVPYEINITWFSALNREDGHGHIDLQIKRFICSRAIAVSIQGVPGIYLHSLLGTRNDTAGVTLSGSNRDINRSVIGYAAMEKELENPDSTIAKVLRKTTGLVMLRTKQPAFHPSAPQRVLELGSKVFALLRNCHRGEQRILAIHNIANDTVKLEIGMEEKLGFTAERWYDLISKGKIETDNGTLSIEMEPYDILWLEPMP